MLFRSDRGAIIGYYAVYHTTDDGYSFIFMTDDEITTFAKSKSKTYNFGPWQTDREAMAKKTVIKQLLKYAPISIELQKAITADNTVKTAIDKDMSDLPDETADYIDVEIHEEELQDNIEPEVK